MSLFAIGIGGTGSKCLESLTQLAAVGLIENSKQSIYTLFVDPDETNGNLERARTSLSTYQRCQSLFAKENSSLPWMRTQIEPFGLWSPFSKITTDKQLSALFGYDSLKRTEPDLGDLFDVLFTPAEREATLDVGFRGRPAIGSAVMSQIDLDNLDEDIWRRLIERIKNDAGTGSDSRIVLFGSIFGGTGASGLPTIGRLIDQKLKDENIREKVPISCVFLLPYFSFTAAGKMSADEVYARSDQFLLNTEAALRYYLTQAQPFNSVYLLGNQNPSEVSFSLGKNSQKNQPHFIELYASLAARHFINNPRAHEKTLVSLISRESSRQVLWKDLPETDIVRNRLANSARFSYVWLSNIESELARAKEIGIAQFQREAPWFIQFFQPVGGGLFGRVFGASSEELPDFNAPEQQQAISYISEWCRDFLRWLTDIHQYRDESVELFRADILSEVLGNSDKDSDELAQLVRSTELDRSRLSQDTISNIKLDLDTNDISQKWGKGTTGLAKALYARCKL